MIRLQLEGAPLVDAYRQIQGLWFEYTNLIAAPEEHFGEIAEILTRLSAQVSTILTESKSNLDALAEPL